MSSPLVPVRQRVRVSFAAVAVAATALFTFGGVPLAANAADVDSVAALEAALSPGTDATVTLTADAYESTADLIVDRDVTLDLDGHDLMTNSITVTSGHTLTLIADSGLRTYLINIDGTLQLASDLRMQPYALVTVGTDGLIVSDSTVRTLGGAQSVANNGTITASIDPSQQVTGNNFTVRFVDNRPTDNFVTFSVYAPTLAAAGIATPSFPRVHAEIASWNSESDGSGAAFTDTTPLSGIWGTYYAQWVADGITDIALSYEGSPDPARAGQTMLIASDASPGGDGGDISDLVEFSSNDPADAIDDFGSVQWLNAELVGTRVVTGVLRGNLAVQNTVEVTVIHSGSISRLALTMTPGEVVTGSSSTAYLSATDVYGNSFGYNLIVGNDDCEYCETTVTSSDPIDQIDPSTGEIRFTTLGPRTITATVQQIESDPWVATATVTVVAEPTVPTVPTVPAVIAPPQGLAATGSDSGPVTGAALLLALGGLGALMLVRGRGALKRRMLGAAE